MSPAKMVNEQSSQCEVIKCVVVGDSGTGKTCLTCAWACDSKYDLHQLVKTHVASVWAIDHYRNDKEVLDKSWCEVDTANVSLRIWDTFGYHDKDRRFAYRGADVIIVCFSTAWPNSLRNVKKVWYPEIRRFCPTTPIILAGAQCDLRYMYREESFIKLEKGLMYKHIAEKDIITPELGREVAKDIGAPYYETSVLTQHGVHDLFINSARAALIERRKIKFWSPPLRRVQRPLLQVPMKLPVPPLPKVTVPSPTLNSDLSTLLFSEAEADCVLRVKDTSFPAHRIILMVANEMFEKLFTADVQASRQSSTRPQDGGKVGGTLDHGLHSDKDRLLDSDQDSVCTDITDPCSATPSPTPTPAFSHPAVLAVEQCLREGKVGLLGHRHQTVITLSPEISVQGLRGVLEFIYTGQLRGGEVRLYVEEVKAAATALGMMDLLVLTSNLLSGEVFLNPSLLAEVAERRHRKTTDLALEKELLSDITFQVDDGLASAHKALLMARCEMMFAMFSSDFLESSIDVIPYPGMTQETFKVLQAYLYTGELPSINGADVLSLIEVANRLCLPRLVALTEAHVVTELQRLDSEGVDVVEDALIILEQAQLHNALQLYHWCRVFLSNHFQEMTQKYNKLYRSLQKENQEVIEKHRWPPVWYLREIEYYDRHVHDTKHPEQRQQQDFNRWPSCSSSCLCFCRRGRMRMDDPVELPI